MLRIKFPSLTRFPLLVVLFICTSSRVWAQETRPQNNPTTVDSSAVNSTANSNTAVRGPFSANKPSLEEDMSVSDETSGRGVMRNFSPQGPAPTLSYSGWYAPQGNSSEMYNNNLSYSQMVYKNENEVVTAYTSRGALYTQAPPTLPNGVSVPQNLEKIDFGANYARRMPDGKMAGGGVGIGSASDRPLSYIDVDTYTLSAFYGYKIDDNSSLVWSAYLSNNNSISNSLPLPGFLYIYRKENLMVRVGFPTATVVWRPQSPWLLSASLFGTIFNCEVAYGHRRELQTFLGYRGTEQSYLRVDRTNKKDRLRESENRIYTGIRLQPTRNTDFEVQGGYAYNRFFSENSERRSLFGETPSNSVNLGASWFISTSVRFAFN